MQPNISDEDNSSGQATLNCAPENLPLSKTGRAEFNAFFSSPYLLGELTSRTVKTDGKNYPEQYTGCRRILNKVPSSSSYWRPVPACSIL